MLPQSYNFLVASLVAVWTPGDTFLGVGRSSGGEFQNLRTNRISCRERTVVACFVAPSYSTVSSTAYSNHGGSHLLTRFCQPNSNNFMTTSGHLSSIRNKSKSMV